MRQDCAAPASKRKRALHASYSIGFPPVTGMIAPVM